MRARDNIGLVDMCSCIKTGWKYCSWVPYYIGSYGNYTGVQCINATLWNHMFIYKRVMKQVTEWLTKNQRPNKTAETRSWNSTRGQSVRKLLKCTENVVFGIRKTKWAKNLEWELPMEGRTGEPHHFLEIRI